MLGFQRCFPNRSGYCQNFNRDSMPYVKLYIRKYGFAKGKKGMGIYDRQQL